MGHNTIECGWTDGYARGFLSCEYQNTYNGENGKTGNPS
jgi:hypothetical protein